MPSNYQNSIDGLTHLDNYRFENIFRIYQDDKTYYYYNILRNISFPTDLDPTYYTIETVNFDLPLTTISYKFYFTIELWWLILVVNNITNPFISGTKKIKIIKPQYVDDIIDLIINQL